METLSYAEVAERLNLKNSRVHQLIKENKLLVVPGEDGKKAVVADSLQEVDGVWQPVDHLSGTMNLLLDGGCSKEEATNWMLNSDNEYFDVAPLQMLRDGLHHRVNRVASFLGF